MAKEKGQKMNYKILHRKLKFKQWELIENETLQHNFNLPMFNISFICRSIKYISLSWYDISEFVYAIRISLKECSKL
jgi:hypothetical protein